MCGNNIIINRRGYTEEEIQEIQKELENIANDGKIHKTYIKKEEKE